MMRLWGLFFLWGKILSVVGGIVCNSDIFSVSKYLILFCEGRGGGAEWISNNIVSELITATK